MNRGVLPFVLVLLSAVASCVASALEARAQTPPTVPASPRLGGDIRIRGEAFDNLLDLRDGGDDAYQFTRMRYRLWLEAKPREEVKLYFRLGGEYRWGQQAAPSIRDPESRVSLDNGWMEIVWPANSGLTWRLGRQDLAYGEGFLIFDGTPADGSSSAYFDAVRARWQRGSWTIDAFTAKLSDRGFATAARDEDLHGLYAIRSLSKATAIEAYVLHRFKHQATVSQAGKPWAIMNPPQQTTAVGARVSHLPETGKQLAAEGAYQFGTYHDRGETGVKPSNDRRAFGGYARTGVIAPVKARPAVEIGGLYLSGGNHEGTYQGWDPFYSEWPKWSELLIYTLNDATTRLPVYRNDAGSWTNLAAVWLEISLEPVSGTKGIVRETVLRSTESNASLNHGDSRSRGMLTSVRLDQKVPVGVTLQVLGERFDPGAYYKKLPREESPEPMTMTDPAWYVRCQITAAF